MGVTNSNKTASLTQINCDGTFDVTLAPDRHTRYHHKPHPDIVLVLDRSGSMEGSALANLKLGAKKFIQIIDQATDGSGDGQIGSGSRIGIVSFAGTASQDTALITSVAALDAAVDNLSAGGLTNHADAFSVATSLLSTPSSNAKVMVMFTDGNTTAGRKSKSRRGRSPGAGHCHLRYWPDWFRRNRYFRPQQLGPPTPTPRTSPSRQTRPTLKPSLKTLPQTSAIPVPPPFSSTKRWNRTSGF